MAVKTLASSLTVALIVAFAGISGRAEERMLAHDVYFSLNDSSPQAKEKLIAACKTYLSGHPGTVRFAVGPLADDMKRDVNDRDFDVALHLVFKSKAAHDQYAKAQRHLKFIEENKDNWKKVRVFNSYVEAFVPETVRAVSGAPARLPGSGTGIVARTQANDAARRQIGLLKKALETYKLDTGDYPTTEQGLQALRVRPAGVTNLANWSGPYLDKDVPLDPWKRPFRYRYPGKRVPTEPEIWSLGADGIDGTADDIGSAGTTRPAK